MDLTATIDHLPPEILGAIFGYLNLSELVEKKRVCKLWNGLISSNLKIDRLVVNPYNYKKERWYHVPGGHVDQYLEVCHPNLFFAQHDRPILSNLKYLRILQPGEHSDQQFDETPLTALNRFPLLEHLEIDFSIHDQTQNIEWSLPNLRILNFQLFLFPYSEGDFQISVDAPKLHTLCWSRGLNLKSPETIITLEADLYGEKLSNFRNVETYHCSAKLEFVNDALIRQLPKLKTLDLFGDVNNLKHAFEGIDQMRQFLKQLLAHRRRLVKPELRLFFAGIEIKSEELIDNLDLRMTDQQSSFSSEISNEHLYLGENYPANLQDELEFIRKVDYTRLMSIRRNEIPNDYFRRFFNIRDVIAFGEIQDPAHFASFLKRLEYFDSLFLRKPSLDQAWYDRLPTICALTYIYLEENDEVELNFDFLGCFENLCSINIMTANGAMYGELKKRELKLESAKSLPNLFKYFKRYSGLRKFRFILKGMRSTIRKRKSGENTDQSDDSACSGVSLEYPFRYDVKVGKQLKLERIGSMEVLNFFEEWENNLN